MKIIKYLTPLLLIVSVHVANIAGMQREQGDPLRDASAVRLYTFIIYIYVY